MKDLKLKGIDKVNAKNKKVTHKNITPRLKIETIKKLKQLAEVNETSINKVLEYLINEKVS